MTSRYIQRNKGFTLVELMVAMALFAIVAVAALTAMLSVLEANQRTQSSVRAMDGLSFALESITRELRVGSDYQCNNGGPVDTDPATTRDCSGESWIAFTTSENNFMEYKLLGTAIVRRVNGADWVPITGLNVVVDNFDLYTLGSLPNPGDKEQPRVLMLVEGTAGVDVGEPRSYKIQTTITQRFPDF